MGDGISCFGLTARRSRVRGTNPNDRSVSLLSSIIGFMKTSFLCGDQNKNDRKERSRRQPPKMKKRQQQPKVKTVKVLTLEDCLSNVDGGGYDEPKNVFQQFPKKVYSSLDEEESSNFSSSTPINGKFSTETLLKVDQVNSSSNPEVDRISPFTSKQQNGKTEKKVSFTLPGEADIYVYSMSPEKESSICIEVMVLGSEKNPKRGINRG